MARTWGNIARGWPVEILSLSLQVLPQTGLSDSVSAHDLHDDAGDHEGEQEEYDVEGYSHYVHKGRLGVPGL